jgi:hypothetical protein
MWRTLDKNDEGEAVVAKIIGSIAAQNKDAQDREPMREIMGSALSYHALLSIQ